MKHIKNKKWQIFKTILLTLLLIFFINHYNIKNGYQEKLILEKTILTKNNIEEFEKDIKNKKYIDIKNYNTNKPITSNNKVGEIGYKTSETISKVITKGTKKIYNFLKLLFT